MSNFVIYEDQENRVPVHILEGFHHKNGSENVVGQHTISLSNQNQKYNLNILQNKRTVLSNITSNVRVQPRRAAKQGVSYESGAPHSQDTENICPQTRSKSLTSIATNLPSFIIHEDDSSSSSNSIKSSSSSLNSSTTLASSLRSGSSSDSQDGSKFYKSQAVILGSKKAQDAIRSPLKDKFNTKNIQPADNKRVSIMAPRGVTSPEDMDVSVTEGVHMSVDTPAGVVSTLQREGILLKKDQEFWDVPEYSNDIYQYLREAEICHKPRLNYMLKQTDITSSMRWILIDWLVEVGEEYSLHTETLYLAVSYIDRFLSHMSVKRDKLQLVGTTAMFIASKYEEIYPPDVNQFAYITDNTYRVSQILRMEHLILKVLSFDMAVPTSYLFVSYFTTVGKCKDETTHLAMFLSELSMLESDPFLRFLPSKIAASAVALANFTQGVEAWPASLATSCKYSMEDLKECYVNLHRSFCRIHEPSQHAIRDKYKSSKLSSVSALSPRDKFPW